MASLKFSEWRDRLMGRARDRGVPLAEVADHSALRAAWKSGMTTKRFLDEFVREDVGDDDAEEALLLGREFRGWGDL